MLTKQERKNIANYYKLKPTHQRVIKHRVQKKVNNAIKDILYIHKNFKHVQTNINFKDIEEILIKERKILSNGVDSEVMILVGINEQHEVKIGNGGTGQLTIFVDSIPIMILKMIQGKEVTGYLDIGVKEKHKLKIKITKGKWSRQYNITIFVDDIIVLEDKRIP